MCGESAHAGVVDRVGMFECVCKGNVYQGADLIDASTIYFKTEWE